MVGRAKILFYISTIRGGGAARVMVNIANELSKMDYIVCFVTNFPAEHEYLLSETIKRLCLEKTESMSGVVAKNLHRIIELRKIIQKEQPQVCISFMGENNFRLILSSIGINTKTIISVRNDPRKEYSGIVYRIMASFLFPHADGVVFQTDDAKAFFPKYIQKKARIINNQVDEKFFQNNLEVGKYNVACGRLSKQKNYSMMIRAFSKVVDEFPEEELWIYGEGELKNELIDLTNELGIENSICFKGFTTNMVEVYKNAKILVLSSDYEGMPNVMLEALASSVPVISTDCPCGGPRMIIKNGENGYLVPVGDVDALALAWRSVLKEDQTIRSMKKAAYASSQGFRADIVLDNWEDYIKKVVNQ